MLKIDIEKKHGVIGYYTRMAKDVLADSTILSDHYVRIGKTEEEYGRVDNAEWLCEIHINSIEQALDYAAIFQKIANRMREEKGEQ